LNSIEKITELKNYFAKRYECLDIANEVLDDPKFSVWSGAGKSDQHHYGDGGLLQHTYEVIWLCEKNARVLENAKDYNFKARHLFDKKLFLAALFHDIGKTYDYEKVVNPNLKILDPWSGIKSEIEMIWQHAPHKNKIHHISRSAIIWSRAVDKFSQYRDIEEDVLHAILSHHGRREWGSPIEPQTKMAWLLHLCDSISARMDDCETNKLYK
jgi:3'-5' exoribonuclease